MIKRQWKNGQNLKGKIIKNKGLNNGREKQKNKNIKEIKTEKKCQRNGKYMKNIPENSTWNVREWVKAFLTHQKEWKVQNGTLDVNIVSAFIIKNTRYWRLKCYLWSPYNSNIYSNE